MAQQLRVGSFETDITPRLGTDLIGGFAPRPCVDIKDRLHAKAIAIDNGDSQIALVTVDLCVAVREQLDEAKARIQERTGIGPENVLISATHTHTGPAAVSILGVDIDPEYADSLPWKIADAVECALQRLEPCVFVHGQGEVDQVFNRRWWMKDGTVRMNPGCQNPELVRPAGPVDRALGVLGFRSPEGEPLALYVNYSLHYVGSSPGDHVSADYFARVDNNLRQALGAQMAILSNGACGDVNNCDFANPAPQHDIPNGQAIKVAGIVAGEAARVYHETKPCDEVALAGALHELPVTRRDLDPDQLAEDENLIADMDRMKPTRDEVYALERLELAKQPVAQKTWVQVLRIGDVALVGLPGEMFVELGLEIKERSPVEATLCVELANDWVGYVPTPKAFEEGSYETWTARSSKLTPEAGPDMVEAALRLIEESE